MDVKVGLWRKLSAEELMLLNCGVGEDSWESLGLQGDPTSPFWRRSTLGVLWKESCLSWDSSTLATSCEELTHWKRPWCWERSKAGGEGDNRGWDSWMASLTWWTWVWVSSGSWWQTGKPGVLQSMRSQRVRHDWANELNWTELKSKRPQVKPLFSINFSCFSSDPLGVEIIVYLSGNNCISKFFANIMPSYLKPCITDGLPSLGSLRDASCLKTPVRLSGLIIHILSLFI